MRPSSDENRPLLDGQQATDSDSEAQPNGRHTRLSSSLKRLTHPDQLSTLEKLLLFISLVILLVSFLFLGLFLGAYSKLKHSKPIHGVPGGHDGNGGSGLDSICTSPDCVYASAEILRGIDPSVNPCEDFYRFAAGGWLASHPIPSDQGLFGIAQFLNIENAKTLKQLLADAPITKDASQSSISTLEEGQRSKVDLENLSKLRAFYDSCLDLDLQDEAGSQPLLDVVEELSSRLNGEKNFDQSQQEEPVGSVYLEKNDIPVPPSKPPGRAPISHPPTEDPSPLPPMSGRQKDFTEALVWGHSRGELLTQSREGNCGEGVG